MSAAPSRPALVPPVGEGGEGDRAACPPRRRRRYNLQSGKPRAAAAAEERHEGAVRGLAAAADGRTLFSCGGDGTLRLWAPAALKLQSTADVGCACGMLRHKRDSTLVALAADDLSVRVMDAVALRLVRRLEGHTNTLTDVAWGADARWVLSSALDCTLCAARPRRGPTERPPLP